MKHIPLGDEDEPAARERLEALLEERLASARAGWISSRSVNEVFEAAFRENDRKPTGD